jgi:O-antigen ligase
MTSIAYAALWLFVFTLPWENVIAIGKVAILSRVTGALALGIAMIAVATTGRFRRLHAFHLAALLYIVWMAIELVVFFGSVKPPAKFWTYCQLALVLWMVWELAPTWRRQFGLLSAYVLGCYIAALDTIWLYRSQADVLRRFSAGNTDPNDLAMTLALALPMAWYVGMHHRSQLMRWICRGYLPVGIIAIGLTGSRGGLLTTIVALMVIPLTMDRLTPGRLMTALLLLVGSAGLAAVYIPETIVKRLSTTGAEVEDASFGNRFRLWRAGWHVFEQRPMTGVGTGGYVRAVTPELGSDARVAHNTYLSVLVEQGIVGLMLYLLMFLAVYRAIRHLPKLERRFALTLFATLLIAILPLTWEDRKPVWFVLAALLGLSQAWIAESGALARQAAAGAGQLAGARAAAGRRMPLATPRADQDAIA